MAHSIDEIDRRILRALQGDASDSIDTLAEKAGMSRNACWRRVKLLEEAGIIRRRVALLDPEALGLGLLVLVLIRTKEHGTDWLEKFDRAVRSMPEIIGAYRMAGDLDYVLKVRVASVKDYDRFYQRLIAKVPLQDISASFVMDEIKETHELPI
ncbi:MAG: Lrp/AsnC family transcriptional regulator [Rhodobacteraceae bacterium]|nr:Lrp/AsnC family transcriptional regulator [Paracoccaceae bacterium]